MDRDAATELVNSWYELARGDQELGGEYPSLLHLLTAMLPADIDAAAGALLIAPEPPIPVRRADLTRQETIDRLQAELHRRFEVERALHPRPDERRGSFWS